MSVVENIKTPSIVTAVTTQSVEMQNSALMTPLPPPLLPPVKLTPLSTPLRAKNQQLQQQQAMLQTPIATLTTVSVEKEKLDVMLVGSNKSKATPKSPDEFWKDLQHFHERRGTPMTHKPRISGKLVDLYLLYNEVTERGGFNKVNMRDEWDEVYSALETLHDKCANGTAGIKFIYRRFLEKYERLTFFGEDPDKMEALEAAIEIAEMGSGRSRSRYGQHGSSFGSSIFGNQYSALTPVPMSYNYRQHMVNIDRRRHFKFSMDLHKATTYEKLLLSLISPLPNEQDFAINVCTLMTNEAKHTLRLSECPKLVDVLLAHMGVYADNTFHMLFKHVYTNVRRHSQYVFWRDLLHDNPHVLELYKDEQSWMNNGLIEPVADKQDKSIRDALLEDCLEFDFLNLKRGDGTHDYMGQRVLQVVQILRSLSFFDENFSALSKNRTFWRFLVMAANIRWSNVHIHALETAGNVAHEFELLDPASDELSRNLMLTLCDGIDSTDRAVVLNCLEIFYKICTREANEAHVIKCLNMELYQRLCLLLSLNDVMMLIFTLEAIYALTSLGSRPCSQFMQVRGIVDQLVALITVEAQSYGPEGCILMRVVETVPGNMLPLVAQSIASLQNVPFSKQTHIVPPILTAQQPILSQQHQMHGDVQQQQVVVVPHSTLPHPSLPHPSLPHPSLPHPTLPHPSLPHPSLPHPSLPQPSLPQVILPTQSQTTAPIGLPSPTLRQTPTPPPSQTTQHNTSQEDEQYALAWLGATFERASSNESYVEQQELYRLYLAHCQKFGKHSVVNHIQFPRLVRLLYNQTVGPAIVRRPDGTELPGLHYVAIRLRAQPLPIQGKSSTIIASPKGEPARKKKKLLQRPEVTQSPTLQLEANAETTNVPVTTAIDVPKTVPTPPTPTTELVNTQVSVITAPVTAATTVVTAAPKQAQSVTVQEQKIYLPEAKQESDETQNTQPHSTSSLIKSLLANKVNQRQQKQKELIQMPMPSTSQAALPIPQLQMQTTQQQQQQAQPIKVTSNAISALVNNPLMQHTPVKVGQTTIKPLNPQMTMEKKPIISESVPPPLAPLSGTSNVVTKDASGRTVIIANQTLPNTLIKRKLTVDNDCMDNIKRTTLDSASTTNVKDETQVTPSKNAANLYAEMAASILEDEELDDIPPLAATSTQTTQHETLIATQQQQQQLVKMQMPQTSNAPLQTVQRQLVFQTNAQGQPTGAPQLKLASGTTQIPTAMATIKTDQGLQTVPVILQSKPMDQTQPTQIIQQVLQQAAPQPQQQTQYMVATNQQGQTFLVAQQAPPPQQPPTQTVLVTQTPQQQSTGTKTIIILQQQNAPNQHQQQQLITTGNVSGGQKMIMTTSQGQQVLVTQRPPTPQQQIIINPQTGTATHIQHAHIPVSTAAGVVASPVSNTILRQQTTAQQTATGQISPSLLSQLNQIPATIKLHQPQPQVLPQTSQQATISRIAGKTVQLVQTPTPPPPPALQLPALQQHQSIIQQHIISGPNEKRQVLLGGGRAIEIKETLITQAQPAPQQSQLNSQTIITTQPATVGGQPGTNVLQQQQQHIRAVIEQQQHPSIIQQKITMPVASAQQQHLSGTITTSAQPITEMPTLVQATPQILNKPLNVTTSMQQTPTIQAKPTPAILGKKLPETPVATLMKPTLQIATPKPMIVSTTAVSTATPMTATSTANTTAQIIKDTGKQEQKNNIITTATTAANVQTNIVGAATTSMAITSATAVAPSTTFPIATASITPSLPTMITTQPSNSNTSSLMPTPTLPTIPTDINWLFICDWRNCPRRKFKSLGELQHHVCTVHCPDHLDPAAEIYCQWGIGPALCDSIARKRFSLMTHLIDRHLTMDSLRTAVQRRIATGMFNVAPTQPAVTIVRNADHTQRMSTASPALSTASSSSPLPGVNLPGSSAMHAIKRHSSDFINPKELMDENEGPVTKSLRLTASLILRNLVTYSTTAKRNLRTYEPHLATIALSNVESSSALSQILYELNN